MLLKCIFLGLHLSLDDCNILVDNSELQHSIAVLFFKTVWVLNEIKVPVKEYTGHERIKCFSHSANMHAYESVYHAKTSSGRGGGGGGKCLTCRVFAPLYLLQLPPPPPTPTPRQNVICILHVRLEVNIYFSNPCSEIKKCCAACHHFAPPSENRGLAPAPPPPPHSRILVPPLTKTYQFMKYNSRTRKLN